MAKKKATRKKTTKKKSTKASSKKDEGFNPAFVILGILVIASTFYVGYFVGKNSGMSGGSEVVVDDLVVIEYSDFQCPFCTRAAPTMHQLKENYPDVTFIYKHFPLESMHPQAFGAAVAAECVRDEGGEDAFWTYHDTLFENQGALDTASLKQYASDQDLNIDSCLDNEETAETVRAHMAEAQQRGVRGTPSFWIGDELLVGALPYETLSAKVDEKLSGVAAAAPEPSAPAEPSAPVDVAAGNYILGDADAPVLVVEFTDFQCPFCKRAHDQTFPSLMETYVETGKVQYSLRHFPLSFHQNAQKASEAAECAGSVGGADAFWAYSEVLFENQGALEVASLKQYAADMGLDIDECLDSGEFEDLVKADFAAGGQAGVSGTPSFVIDGQLLVGAQPFTSFQTAIDAALN